MKSFLKTIFIILLYFSTIKSQCQGPRILTTKNECNLIECEWKTNNFECMSEKEGENSECEIKYTDIECESFEGCVWDGWDFV